MRILVIFTLFTRFIIACANIVNGFLERNGPQLAAAISFYALFSLFPLALAMISILGYIAGSPRVETQLARQIGELVPVSQDTVISTIEGVVRARHITGIAAIVGLLWASNAVFGAIRKSINTVWGIRRPRPFLHERFIDFSLTVGAGLMILISIAATAALSFAREISKVLLPELAIPSDLVWNLVAGVIPFIITFFVFAVIYWLLPNTQVRFRYVIPGALAGAVAFEAVKNFFVYYVRTYAQYNILYGPISTVLVLMTWLYLSAFILLLWAAVTAYYANYMEERAVRRRWRQVFVSTRTEPVKIGLKEGNGHSGDGHAPEG